MTNEYPYDRAAKHIKLLWGNESAHEDTITVVQLISTPPGMLTASTDRCVKMWMPDGSPVGLLLQGTPLYGHTRTHTDTPAHNSTPTHAHAHAHAHLRARAHPHL